jgi:FtsP/CotA-like multicopper oxidase with cupredoxin domain
VRRTRLLIALGVAVALGLSACGGMDDDEGGPAAGMTTAPTTEAETTTSEATTTEAEPEGPRQIGITYRRGKLGGDSGTVRVRRGEEIQLTVRADVEEEVHVHGYDLSAAVAPGHPAKISFVADRQGNFVIELEHLHLHIAELRVQ